MYFGNPPIITNGLILYLDAGNKLSYPGSGTTWNDLSGNGYTGSLQNTPIFSNNSFQLNGNNSNIIFGDVLDMSTNNMTINSWFKLSVTNIAQVIVSKSRAWSQNYRYSFGVASGGGLGFFIQGNGGGDVETYTSQQMSVGIWYMGTSVINRASSFQIYMNGQLQQLNGSATIPQWNGLDFQSNNPFRIGSYTASDNVTPISTFTGSISQVSIYNRGLTASEVLQNYNATKGRYGL